MKDLLLLYICCKCTVLSLDLIEDWLVCDIEHSQAKIRVKQEAAEGDGMVNV